MKCCALVCPGGWAILELTGTYCKHSIWMWIRQGPVFTLPTAVLFCKNIYEQEVLLCERCYFSIQKPKFCQVSENFRIAFVLNVINYSSSKIYVFGYKKLPERTTLQKGITVSKNFLFFFGRIRSVVFSRAVCCYNGSRDRPSSRIFWSCGHLTPFYNVRIWCHLGGILTPAYAFGRSTWACPSSLCTTRPWFLCL